MARGPAARVRSAVRPRHVAGAKESVRPEHSTTARVHDRLTLLKSAEHSIAGLYSLANWRANRANVRRTCSACKIADPQTRGESRLRRRPDRLGDGGSDPENASGVGILELLAPSTYAQSCEALQPSRPG